MDRRTETDANVKIVNEVDRSSKSASSFCNVGFILPSSIVDAAFEVLASPVASVVAEKLAGKGQNMTGAKMTKMTNVQKVTKLTSDMLIVQLFFNIYLHPITK